MAWRGTFPSLGFAAAAMGFAIMGPQLARAADLDEAYQRPRPYAAIRGAPGAVIDPRCRVIPQPELNLYGDTARFRPTLVCMSRGLLADSYGPYAPYDPY